MNTLRTPYNNKFGLIPLTIYTKPYKCGGNCLFCFTQDDMPKSYFSNEDTILASNNGWKSNLQLDALFTKHKIVKGSGNKIEIIILGGSFTFFPNDYQESYIKDIYDFLNGFVSNTFEEAKLAQKYGKDRCVVLAVETRPDLISDEVCEFLLHLGVTKIEIGVQSLNPEVLKLNRRLHKIEQVISATKTIKKYGFKLGYHMMVGLPGSSYIDDLNTFKSKLWENEFCPDYLKIYPCVILKGSNNGQELIKNQINNGWTPLDNETYKNLILEIKQGLKKYVYLNRIQRIAEPEAIEYGPSTIVERKQFSPICNCIWHRSIVQVEELDKVVVTQINIKCYSQSNGYYIEAINENNKILGFLRLTAINEISIIREIRVYGSMKNLSTKYEFGVQHSGVGKKLMMYAENFAKENGCKTLLVNSGIGVKQYFEKLNYVDSGTYMHKSL